MAEAPFRFSYIQFILHDVKLHTTKVCFANQLTVEYLKVNCNALSDEVEDLLVT